MSSGGTIAATGRIDCAAASLHPRAHWQRAIWPAILLLGLFASRWALAPRYLVTFDEINFAYSIAEFSPALHQPQPPGYPLFVGLLKLLAAVFSRVETVFFAAALMLSVIALGSVWLLGDRVVGQGCGGVAAALLLWNPAFWVAALMNPVRLSLAAGASVVAACLWMAVRKKSPLWFYAAAFLLGVAAGFRPSLPFVMFPLAVWAGFRLRANIAVCVIAAAAFAAAVLTWGPVLISASGGLRAYAKMLQDYSNEQVGPTSVLFAAPVLDVMNMAWKAVVWSCLGTLSWAWAVPAAWRRPNLRETSDRLPREFLLLWFLPGLLFSAAVHVADASHMLAIVPPTCLAGAAVLARFAKGASRRKRTLVIAVALLLNMFLFIKPISKTAAASTYKPVRWLDRYIADVVDGVRTLRGRGRLTVIFEDRTTGWRQLSLYEPSAEIISAVETKGGVVTTRHIHGSRMEARSSQDEVVRLPACGVFVWVDPVVRPVGSGGPVQSVNARVSFTDARAGDSWQFRGFRFVSVGGNCD